MGLLETFLEPPREFTLIPFWFLNDQLDETELRRQLDDFAAHGVYGVVPHARIGLPEEIGWMSEPWLHFLKIIVEHCAEQGMKVVLYDEGMYPSGSCAGRVVAANPRHAARCLERRPRKGLELAEDEELIAEAGDYAYVHTRSLGTIRGVHYTADGGEFSPPAGDILNPEAVARFLHLTHDAHFERLGGHFGATIIGIFTDEPSMLGRGGRKDVRPWTWDFGAYLKRYLGYDFTPHLAALWDKGHPEAERHAADFHRAANARLEEVYYRPYSEWCAKHGVMLTGHPAGPMDIGVLKHFQLPGQDVVWRYLEPFKDTALEGPQSTMGKCSASAQVHYGRGRNLNECFGAYGWEFSWEEMRWLTNWLLVRGVNLLSPHAFYYSVRGPRHEERPPDVGPNNTWWDKYKTYADYCRRLCWLLAQGRQVCSVAVLGTPTQLPWRAARVLFEHQYDFNYLDTDALLSQGSVSAEAVEIRGMRYTFLVIDGAQSITPEALQAIKPLIAAGRVIAFLDPITGVAALAKDAAQLMDTLSARVPFDERVTPAQPGLRYHHRSLSEGDFYFFANEGPVTIGAALEIAGQGAAQWWYPESGAVRAAENPLRLDLKPYETIVLFVPREPGKRQS